MSEAGRKVLLVEDEGVLTIFFEDLLSELGYDVVALAQNLADALTHAREAEFDIALLDLNLNGEYSYPVAQALADRGVRFAFVTGYGQVGVVGAYSDAPILRKPFDIAGLRTLLQALGQGDDAVDA